jgi:flagellar biosynthesis/type III secretory pathway M-ring protein FliF/YscJ
MGLKSGSRDAGLDETGDEEEDSGDSDVPTEEADDTADGREQRSTAHTPAETEAADTPAEAESTGQRPTIDSIPYKLRRNKVNEGREQVPYFLREEVIETETELQDTLEEMLGEKVYKSDYREAAMVVAQRNPELVAAVLREWGYDLE